MATKLEYNNEALEFSGSLPGFSGTENRALEDSTGTYLCCDDCGTGLTGSVVWSIAECQCKIDATFTVVPVSPCRDHFIRVSINDSNLSSKSYIDLQGNLSSGTAITCDFYGLSTSYSVYYQFKDSAGCESPQYSLFITGIDFCEYFDDNATVDFSYVEGATGDNRYCEYDFTGTFTSPCSSGQSSGSASREFTWSFTDGSIIGSGLQNTAVMCWSRSVDLAYTQYLDHPDRNYWCTKTVSKPVVVDEGNCGWQCGGCESDPSVSLSFSYGYDTACPTNPSGTCFYFENASYSRTFSNMQQITGRDDLNGCWGNCSYGGATILSTNTATLTRCFSNQVDVLTYGQVIAFGYVTIRHSLSADFANNRYASMRREIIANVQIFSSIYSFDPNSCVYVNSRRYGQVTQSQLNEIIDPDVSPPYSYQCLDPLPGCHQALDGGAYLSAASSYEEFFDIQAGEPIGDCFKTYNLPQVTVPFATCGDANSGGCLPPAENYTFDFNVTLS